MEIKKRIEKIKDYFQEMRVEMTEEDNKKIFIIYVSVIFPPKWIVSESTIDKFKVDFTSDKTFDKSNYENIIFGPILKMVSKQCSMQ